MIRIIEVTSDSNIGGAGRILLTLLAEMDRKQFEPIVVLPGKSLLKDDVLKTGTRVIDCDEIAEKSLSFSAIGKLCRIFREVKPDLVHTHASMSARIAARLCGIKVVYTRHSVFDPPQKLTHGLGKFINGAVNNSTADGIIAVADAAKENLTAVGVDGRKITVILNGVYPTVPETNTDELKKRFGISDGEKCVAIIARLEDIKGHDYFIEAAKALIDEGIKAKFIIAGTGSYEEALKQKVKSLGVENNVLFTGFITDVNALLSVCDLQINCSYGTEATSLSLLEGMSLGIPAVVSDFGGNPGVISDGVNGLIVPKKNTKALTEAIKRVLGDDELYKKLSNGSKEVFSQKFTAAAMTRQTEGFYKAILGGKERKEA